MELILAGLCFALAPALGNNPLMEDLLVPLEGLFCCSAGPVGFCP